MMVISRVEEGNTLLCRTAEEQMTVFAAALFLGSVSSGLARGCECASSRAGGDRLVNLILHYVYCAARCPAEL